MVGAAEPFKPLPSGGAGRIRPNSDNPLSFLQDGIPNFSGQVKRRSWTTVRSGTKTAELPRRPENILSFKAI